MWWDKCISSSLNTVYCHCSNFFFSFTYARTLFNHIQFSILFYKLVVWRRCWVDNIHNSMITVKLNKKKMLKACGGERKEEEKVDKENVLRVRKSNYYMWHEHYFFFFVVLLQRMRWNDLKINRFLST